ncbi:MAG TPA: PqqD family protein [Acidimicrobiales bacterium]
MSPQCPESVGGLDIHEVESGLVVYDATTDRVHYLNATAAVVLSLCDGTRTETDVAELVRVAWELDIPPVDEVRACVAQLRDEGVLR